MTAATPASETVTLKLDSSARRQLDQDGLIALWRDGREPEQREGLVCWLAGCPDPDCKCKDVLVEGFTVDARATAIHWDDDGLRVEGSAALAPSGVVLKPKLFASVDIATGEMRDDPDSPTASEPALLEWLATELDGEVLDAFYRYWTGVKGFFFEQPRAKIDIHAVEEYHLLVIAVPTHVAVELAEVLVREPVALELDEDVALQDAVVEDQVHEEVLAPDQNPALTCLEAEPTAELGSHRRCWFHRSWGRCPHFSGVRLGREKPSELWGQRPHNLWRGWRQWRRSLRPRPSCAGIGSWWRRSPAPERGSRMTWSKWWK